MIKIESVKKEYDKLLAQLSDPELISDYDKFQSLSQRKNFLEKIIEKDKEIQEIKNKIEENKAILSAQEDAELFSLAQEELISFRERQKSLEKELAVSLEASLAPAGRENSSAIIVEIRAGTGGEEAALFAGDLFRMYSKYAAIQNWNQKILDSHPSELNGFKEIIFELKPARHSPEARLTSPASELAGGRAKPMADGNSDVFSKMKYEAGVHRVQRIPETEKLGRIHTSTASVAVLLKPKKTQIKINPQDLRIDFYRASGKGGQNVNKRETAVRITHLPTGLVVTSQTERNQLQNKENAMSILEARFLKRKEMENLEKFGQKRRSQIGKAKRAEKIKTYNFPQNRLTDHRIKKTWHNLEEIMKGKLEEIIKKQNEILEGS